jgi:hypothetical protein
MKRLVASVIAAAALVAVACGGGDNAPEPAATSDASAISPSSTAEADSGTAGSPTLAPGWKAYTIEPVEIALPQEYVAGPSEAATFDAIRKLGPNCAAAAALFEAAADVFGFIGVDSQTCETSSIHSVQILAFPAEPNVADPDDFAAAFLQDLTDNAAVLDRTESLIGGKPASVLTIRRTYQTGVNIQRLYAIRANDGTWFVLAAAATEADFTAAASRFDAIAQTMRFQ